MGQASPLLVFASERCTTGLPLPKETEAATAGSPLQHRCQELLEVTSVLTWRRTCKDPFVGQWEQILSWIQADPTRTGGDILRELQALFPGRYQPLQVRTLQRDMRKIRAHLLTTREEQWQQELIPTAQFQKMEATAQQSSIHTCSPFLLTTRDRSPTLSINTVMSMVYGKGLSKTKSFHLWYTPPSPPNKG